MKKHRIVTVVLAIFNLVLALYLWCMFMFAWGPNLPAMAQSQRDTFRLQVIFIALFFGSYWQYRLQSLQE